MSETLNHSQDNSHRFFFEDANIRGEIATIKQSLIDATIHQQNPPILQKLLGEFLVAASLLTGVLKFKGLLVLQVRGDGPVPLVMAETTHNKDIRGIIKANDDFNINDLKDSALQTLIGKGVLTLTIDPEKGQRYQGIVALEGETLADCLNAYFKQSEQLPSHLWLSASEDCATGLLLQTMPKKAEETDADDAWSSAYQLAATVKNDELLTLDHQTILYRLFNEFNTRISEPQSISFHCSCSRERSVAALNAIGKEDALALIQEQGDINIDCDFCGNKYTFTEKNLEDVFSDGKELH